MHNTVQLSGYETTMGYQHWCVNHSVYVNPNQQQLLLVAKKDNPRNEYLPADGI